MNILQAQPRETDQEAGGYVRGVAVAVVTQNQDDDGQCRVKVSYPWHEKPRDSYWARLAMPMAGKDRGMVLIPEVGDEVLVAFERDDLAFPCILGSLYNGQDGPPFQNDDGENNRRGLVSRAKSQWLFVDDDTLMAMLKSGAGAALELSKDTVKLHDGNGNQVEIDRNSGAMKLETSGQLTIKAASISMEASGTVELKAGATLTIQGAMVNIN